MCLLRHQPHAKVNYEPAWCSHRDKVGRARLKWRSRSEGKSGRERAWSDAAWQDGFWRDRLGSGVRVRGLSNVGSPPTLLSPHICAPLSSLSLAALPNPTVPRQASQLPPPRPRHPHPTTAHCVRPVQTSSRFFTHPRICSLLRLRLILRHCLFLFRRRCRKCRL